MILSHRMKKEHFRAKRNSLNTSSSVASVYMTKNLDTEIDESCWTDTSNKDLDAYTKSKTLAERLLGIRTIKLTTILPPVVLIRYWKVYKERIHHDDKQRNASKMGIVDVRDVAKMHVAALRGKRFIVSENIIGLRTFVKW